MSIYDRIDYKGGDIIWLIKFIKKMKWKKR